MNGYEVERIIDKIKGEYEDKIHNLKVDVNRYKNKTIYREFLINARQSGCDVDKYIIEEIQNMKDELNKVVG